MTGRMRVAIVGGGSVGSVLAEQLSSAGHDVEVYVRTPRAGISVRTDGESRPLDVPIRTSAEGRPAVDWLLLATKAQDSGSAAPTVDALTDEHSRVLVCQNGVGRGRAVSALIRATRVVPAVVTIVAERVAGGVVDHHGGWSLEVADDALGREAVELFGGTRVEVTLSEDFAVTEWRKFLGNLAAGPVTALCDRRMDVLGEPAVRELLRAILAEAVLVARAEGVALADTEVDDRLRSLVEISGLGATTSMQSDRSSGRELETDLLTGELVRLADAHGVAVPVNRALLALLSGLRAGAIPGGAR